MTDLQRAHPVFISYRRADSQDVTERIYDHLSQKLGQDTVFKDVNHIQVGQNFAGALKEATANCKVMLVVIGPDWLNAQDTQGNRRLDDPQDWVRQEVETGLQRDGTRVIPLLVKNATMLSANALPVNLRELAFKNALSIRNDPDFHTDMERLIAAISPFITQRRGKWLRRWDWKWIIAGITIPLIAAFIQIVPSILPPSTPTSIPTATETATSTGETVVTPTITTRETITPTNRLEITRYVDDEVIIETRDTSEFAVGQLFIIMTAEVAPRPSHICRITTITPDEQLTCRPELLREGFTNEIEVGNPVESNLNIAPLLEFFPINNAFKGFIVDAESLGMVLRLRNGSDLSVGDMLTGVSFSFVNGVGLYLDNENFITITDISNTGDFPIARYEITDADEQFSIVNGMLFR